GRADWPHQGSEQQVVGSWVDPPLRATTPRGVVIARRGAGWLTPTAVENVIERVGFGDRLENTLRWAKVCARPPALLVPVVEKEIEPGPGTAVLPSELDAGKLGIQDADDRFAPI